MGFKDKIMMKAMEKAMKSGKLKERIEKAQRDMVTWEKDIRKQERANLKTRIEKITPVFRFKKGAKKGHYWLLKEDVIDALKEAE